MAEAKNTYQSVFLLMQEFEHDPIDQLKRICEGKPVFILT